jgi:hypothetical protein
MTCLIQLIKNIFSPPKLIAMQRSLPRINGKRYSLAMQPKTLRTNPSRLASTSNGPLRLNLVFSFDVDSLLGFVGSPAVATHGIWFYSAPQYKVISLALDNR